MKQRCSFTSLDPDLGAANVLSAGGLGATVVVGGAVRSGKRFKSEEVDRGANVWCGGFIR